MTYYVFTNPEKERTAREVVAKKGKVSGGRPDPRTGEIQLAQSTLYERAISEDPKMSDDDLVLYVYRGLGGRVEEFEAQSDADTRADSLKKIRVKQTQKDKSLQ